MSVARYSVLLAVVVLFGCGVRSKATYTVIDHAGNKYADLIFEDNGFGWASFRTEDGKRLVFRGNYSYIEQ